MYLSVLLTLESLMYLECLCDCCKCRPRVPSSNKAMKILLMRHLLPRSLPAYLLCLSYLRFSLLLWWLDWCRDMGWTCEGVWRGTTLGLGTLLMSSTCTSCPRVGRCSVVQTIGEGVCVWWRGLYQGSCHIPELVDPLWIRLLQHLSIVPCGQTLLSVWLREVPCDLLRPVLLVNV